MHSWYEREMLERMRPDCANCGKKNSGYMVSSVWMHDFPCCSDACGRRLEAKLKNGMVTVSQLRDRGYYGNSFMISLQSNCDANDALRWRIKHLEHMLKSHNIKPPKTPVVYEWNEEEFMD
jgi:hypothetical protein